MDDPIQISAARRVFGTDAGLFGVDLTVGAGQIHALVGLNGAGKTTLMRAVLGMVPLDEGSVSIDGIAVQDLPPSRWAQAGHLVEHPFAYPELDVMANLRLAARLRGVAPRRVAGVVEESLAELDLHRYAQVRTRRLSQGNRQRLGLAAALQHHPDVIVLDEPTNALDPAGVILLRQVLARRARAGAAVLVSSHHLDEVARVADRISVMNRGQIIGTLDPGETDLEHEFFVSVHRDEMSRQG
ncbi:MAG TPA: ABC transporter ATP-binding protein [Beutenbergiaceae bacterium]|nr:ABC transporter ATP-binding protein [Beutenbergiaceae bacterium]